MPCFIVALSKHLPSANARDKHLKAKEKRMQRRVATRLGLPLAAVATASTILTVVGATHTIRLSPPRSLWHAGSRCNVPCFHSSVGCSRRRRQVRLLATSASRVSSTPRSRLSRTRQTWADEYYKKHQQIPKPATMHQNLPSRRKRRTDSKNILVIGDVHGCLTELQELHETAMKAKNDGMPFDYVILVGDLVNKGPESAKVVRWVRSQPHWLSVRGNHDDGAIAAALGDETKRTKRKYHWVMQGESGASPNDVVFSDEDLLWLCELPYTITLPASYFGDDHDTIIVHAGLVPGVQVEDQSIETMVTIREVVSRDNDTTFEYHRRSVCLEKDERISPWASQWKGPQLVVFGHDARRGIQEYDYAIGLDSGAVYGKRLTGLVLPCRSMISVESADTYSPVDREQDSSQKGSET